MGKPAEIPIRRPELLDAMMPIQAPRPSAQTTVVSYFPLPTAPTPLLS